MLKNLLFLNKPSVFNTTPTTNAPLDQCNHE